MKTIKNSKELTTLEVGDEVVFGNLSHTVKMLEGRYYLCNAANYTNDRIIKDLRINVPSFNKKLGIKCEYDQEYSAYNAFPEYYSLEALTAIVSALFKEYEKQNELPKTWEEFCERNPIICGESCICPTSEISELDICDRDSIEDKNVCTSKQEAEAFLALMQLRQLRKAYVKDWEPDWTNCRTAKPIITCIEGELTIFKTVTVHRSMSFPNSNLAKQFLDNFKDLLEIAKPLL
jgi:hypothetical protein